jgi:hypothetical protein
LTYEMIAWSTSSPAIRMLVLARADRRRHRLLDDEDLAGARRVRRFLHRALLDAGDPGRDAHHDAGAAHQVAAAVHLADEVAQHPLGGVEVGDDAVLQRADRDDVRRGSTDHPLGLDAYREDLSGVGVGGDDGRLVEDDAASAHVDERVGGAEVDRHVTAEKGQRRAGHAGISSGARRSAVGGMVPAGPVRAGRRAGPREPHFSSSFSSRREVTARPTAASATK